jgi:sarcosine oxidase subunit alpha
VNTIGSLANDTARWMDKLSRFLPVGFYYKAFHSKRMFPRWERMIRAFSGLGRIALRAPRLATPKRYAFCDVLVVGGGVSGMTAALVAAKMDAKVILVEESPRLGGSADHTQTSELVAQVTETLNIETLVGTYAAGYYADRLVSLIEPERMSKVRAQALVLATGAIEQPFVFRNNDLPGIVLASGALRLLRRHAVAVGRTVVVATCDTSGYDDAIELSNHGIRVSHVIDVREAVDDEVAARATQRGIIVLKGHAVREARAGANRCLASVIAVNAVGTQVAIDCDALVMAGSWAPSLHLLLQAGGKALFEEAAQMHLASEIPPGMFLAGRAAGAFAKQTKLTQATQAGVRAASFAHHRISDAAPIRVGNTSVQLQALQVALGGNLVPTPYPPHPDGKDFIDFDEDLQTKDLANAIQEGFDSIELMKRYSTVGMGPSQGKLSNTNAARVLAAVRDLPLGAVGLTTARPMYHPVPMKHLAGRGFTPVRVTPIEARHSQLDAVWMLAGNWHRPEYYARDGETREQSIVAEVAAVRGAVGLIDVGTLGKIEVHGPGAGEFLDRAYTGRYADMKVGTTRYALMLDESGTIIDDGVIARLQPDCYYFTTTTGNSAGVYRELLRLNALWRLECSLVNVTGHRAAFNLAGPRSRDVLSRLTDVNLDASAFPYLGVREGTVAGVSARILRVGFVGELGYEIHVPFSQALAVWDALRQHGTAAGLRCFGVEAQRVLRLEKGHFIIGQDTDGLTNPFEAQADWALKMTKPFFVGQRSLKILAQRGPRQTLVGFEIPTRVVALRECHLIIDGADIGGRITSVAYSSTLGKTIGLAMVKPQLAKLGGTLSMRLSNGTSVSATIVPTPFYDRDNRRQKVEAA